MGAVSVGASFPQGTFQSGAFDPDWGPNSAGQFQQGASGSSSSSGSSVSISTANGVTTAVATIGGRPYTATFPASSSVSSSSSSYTDANGQQVDVFTIIVNGVSYTYRTVDGRTTGPPGGGPFHIVSH
ncbi:hypothetical protein COOONC_14315 [Cooperia oncophora]